MVTSGFSSVSRSAANPVERGQLILQTDAYVGVIGHDLLMRRRRILGRVADVLIPWGVGLFLALVVLDEGRDDSSLVTVAGLLLVVVQAVALRWRRRSPERATAVVLAASVPFQLLIPAVVVPFAGLFAVGSLAAVRPPRVSLPALGVLLAISAMNFFTTTVDDTTFTMAVAVGAWALGEAARNRRVAIEEEAQRALGEEQARIARELHDVIAHSVSMIVVQAAAADDVFDERPDQAREALRSIERAGRDAMRELRRLLSAVRPGLEIDPTEPQPGLERVDELAESLRAGGLEVAVLRVGEPAPLPTGLDLSAYRIVQEALTNTLRHAQATRADVTLTYGADALDVDVRDDGRAAPGNGVGGHGLVGMRERAALLGGTLEAGPQPGGGYRVHAHLPLEAGR
jgi:signal transduction histidine kinase